MSFLKQVFLYSIILSALTLSGCGGKDEKQVEQTTSDKGNTELKRYMASIIHPTPEIKNKAVTLRRSEFKEIPENFFDLYEAKFHLSQINENKKLSSKNIKSLNELSSSELFYDESVRSERNPTLKMEKAKASLLGKVKEATKEIDEVSYIKLPLISKASAEGHSGTYASINSWKDDPDKYGLDVKISIKQNRDKKYLMSAYLNTYLATLTKKEKMILLQANKNNLDLRGDAYFIVERMRNNSISYRPAYIDYYVIAKDTGDIIYKQIVDRFKQ